MRHVFVIFNKNKSLTKNAVCIFEKCLYFFLVVIPIVIPYIYLCEVGHNAFALKFANY